ncbi:MAG: hypothetical protein DHS20C02_14970 [Micavibrio sp.]|nr:MAG: hypothetical protein DHS20C02_14970 [Micavibrio sp.]
MGLVGLDAALSGLRVSQQQIGVISNNIANVSTPGYTRKILPQSSQAIEGVTIGVIGETIIRQVDLNLQRDLWTQISSVGELNVQQAYLSRIEQFHGPPDRELSIAAEISRLQDSFVALADSPEDSFLLAATVNQATDTANKFNDLSNLITTLRNDAQADIQSTVTRVNSLLNQIADLNKQVQVNNNTGRTTAILEDQRDEAIKELTGLIDISFFKRGDGVLVVQTNLGVQLADERVTPLTFDPSPVSAVSYYPDSVAGIFVGDPASNPAAVDITTSFPGGRLGGLIELRDSIFPKQMAQLDELAHKMALRFEAQGLRLFTDASGAVPADTAPDPSAGPPPTAVSYIGFSATIQVNDAIIIDSSLLQQGTVATDASVQPGSSEVIRRILEFTFGDVDFQQAVGSVDLRASLAGGGPFSLQDWLGAFSENTITSTRDIASIGPDLITKLGGPFVVPGADTFSITIDPGTEGPGPIGPLLVDMNAIPPAGNATAADLATFIDGLDPDISATINSFGQLEITSRWDINIADVNMGQVGFDFLGLPQGTINATDPYFDVQVGNDAPVRITILPGDDENDLIDKLILDPLIPGDVGVAGLAYDAVTFAATGELILRPGDDFANPVFGGDIKITSGPFNVDAATAEINLAVPGTLSDGISFVSSLFGSFSAGPPIQDLSPVTNTSYGSEISVANTNLISFRQDLLGPGASISTNLIGSNRLIDYAQKMVNEHSQQILLNESRLEDEETLQNVLQEQILNDSGVNLDEELSNLIVFQTAFAASARVVNAIDELFRELLDAVR